MLWVQLGEPVASVAVPVWVAAGASPEPLWKGTTAPLALESERVRAVARPFKEPDRRHYLDLARLDNAAGTGFLPGLLRTEREILDAAEAALRGRPGKAELAELQDRLAGKALAALRAVTPSK